VGFAPRPRYMLALLRSPCRPLNDTSESASGRRLYIVCNSTNDEVPLDDNFRCVNVRLYEKARPFAVSRVFVVWIIVSLCVEKSQRHGTVKQAVYIYLLACLIAWHFCVTSLYPVSTVTALTDGCCSDEERRRADDTIHQKCIESAGQLTIPASSTGRNNRRFGVAVARWS